jgi:hypothetical protein
MVQFVQVGTRDRLIRLSPMALPRGNGPVVGALGKV